MEDIIELIDFLVDDLNILNLTLTGGEPFLRKDFTDIVLHAKNKNLPLVIQTNGTILQETDVKKLSEILYQKTDVIHISLEGADKDSHDNIRGKGTFDKTIAKAVGVKVSEVIGSDLFLYNRVKPTVWGAGKEYISSSRLDDQECVYTTFEAFLNAESTSHTLVHCVFDNEEVGSGTKQGAASTFLKDTLERINEGLGRTREQYHTALAQSFMLSADNAHAMHPNHTDKADPVNRPAMNKGIVIKFNANQKYTTDGASEAMFRMVLDKAKVPYQMFTNRSDMPGGSTLGNISNTQVALNTVDIGLAQLAMHSPYETAGAKDPVYMAEGVKAFYESDIDVHM
jgi:aspartyl aminopeptidase